MVNGPIKRRKTKLMTYPVPGYIRTEHEVFSAEIFITGVNQFSLRIPTDDLDGKTVDMQFEHGPTVHGLILTKMLENTYYTVFDGGGSIG